MNLLLVLSIVTVSHYPRPARHAGRLELLAKVAERLHLVLGGLREHKLGLQAEVGLVEQCQERRPQRLAERPLRDVTGDVIAARGARRHHLAPSDHLGRGRRVADRWQQRRWPRVRSRHVTLVTASGRL